MTKFFIKSHLMGKIIKSCLSWITFLWWFIMNDLRSTFPSCCPLLEWPFLHEKHIKIIIGNWREKSEVCCWLWSCSGTFQWLTFWFYFQFQQTTFRSVFRIFFFTGLFSWQIPCCLWYVAWLFWGFFCMFALIFVFLYYFQLSSKDSTNQLG